MTCSQPLVDESLKENRFQSRYKSTECTDCLDKPDVHM